MRKYLALLMIIVLFATGCFSIGGRNPVGENITGGDIDDAEDSTQILIDSKAMSGHLANIADTGKAVEDQGKAIQAELDREAPSAEVIGPAATAVVEGAAKIQAEAKAAKKLNKGIWKLAKGVWERAQGKRRWSWLKIILVGMVVVSLILLLFGYATRNLPFWSVIERAGSGVLHWLMNMLSGRGQRLQRAQYLHLDKTDTVRTQDLPLEVQRDIKLAEAEALKVRAKNGG